MYTLSAFLLVISIVVGFVGYYSNKNVVDEYSKITSINLPNIQLIHRGTSKDREVIV